MLQSVQELIHAYQAAADLPSEWTRGLSSAQLAATPVAGKWSMAQLVSHMLDCDLVYTDRIKRVIAQDRPLLCSFDENGWMRAFGGLPVDNAMACRIFSDLRRYTAVILQSVPEAEFATRFGIHTENGRVSLYDLLAQAVRHVTHHAAFAQEKRARLQA